MANIIAGLGAQLGLDTTQFQKGISEAKDSLKELKEYLPEILTAAGFIELTKASIEYANSLSEVAKANEVTVSSVLELTKALEVNGGSAENVGRIYSGFTQKLEAAIQGNATAQKSFEKLGITFNVVFFIKGSFINDVSTSERGRESSDNSRKAVVLKSDIRTGGRGLKIS